MRNYEIMYIINPTTTEEVKATTMEFVEKTLTAAGATDLKADKWGEKKLAYPIQKKSTGFYYLIEFKCNGDFIKKLETEYRRDERIIRFLTVKMDKYAIEYSEKRRTKKETEEPVKEE